jgi:hypothetical protein
MERYICIHGHFYQPPRENPWLEDIEVQDLAYPYHDWNERINAECYAPNTVSRVLDGEGRIVNLTNNNGETYGHHQCFGDMALTYALQYIVSKNLARLTNYGEFLEKHAPRFEVLHEVSLEFTMRRTSERLAVRFRENPDDFTCLRQLAAAVSLVRTMPFEVRLWEAQNIYFELTHTVSPEWRWRAAHGEAEAHDWVEVFLQLGRDLSAKVD